MCPAYRLSPFHRREVASLRALKSTFRGACHPVLIGHRRVSPRSQPASLLDESFDERQRGLGDIAPAAVDRKRVATIGDLADLGEAVVVSLFLVGGFGDRPRDGVVRTAVEDRQWPSLWV